MGFMVKDIYLMTWRRITVRKIFWLLVSTFLLTVLVACGDDELSILEVEFEVPETVEVGETVELKATVTYGDDMVTDADEVVFEVWEKGKRDDGDMIDALNHEDGTYTTEVTFDHDGIFEMYAHTTARDMHTMPKKEIVVGEGGDYGDVDGENTAFHTEGFDLHFMEPDEPVAGEEIDLVVHIMIHDDEFEDADVRYEIWNYDVSDNHDWIDAVETVAGEYTATYSFDETGTYHIQIHVEDDDDLHEHAEYDINVSE